MGIGYALWHLTDDNMDVFLAYALLIPVPCLAIGVMLVLNLPRRQ